MKLRTELYTTRRGLLSFGYDDDMLKHDAMAAHALLQAMGIIMPECEMHEITGKAAEILAGWLGEE